MEKFLTLLIILLSFESFSQDDKVETNQQSKFKIGIVAQPNLAYRKTVNTSYTIEVPKLGHNFGINTEIRLTNKLFLETGINYSNKGFRTKKLDPLLFPSSSIELPMYRAIFNFHYLEIPLLLNYSIGKKKLKFISTIGLGVDILIAASLKGINYYDNGKKESSHEIIKNNNYNKFNLSPTVGLGVEYQINQNSKIKVQPVFSYGILKISDLSQKRNLWSTGLQFGYYFGI